MRVCQGRISSDHCTLCLRNLPGEALCQAGFIRGAAWKSCSLRSTLSPFTATSLGKHMAVVKAQLPLTFSGWKENTQAVGRVGRKFLSCQSACAAIQRDPSPPPYLFYPASAFVTQRHCHLPGQPQVTQLDSRRKHMEPTCTNPL